MGKSNICHEQYTIDVIYSDGDVVLALDDENVDFDSNKISPIPLTEEWLLKFGFDVEDNGISTYYGRQHDFSVDIDTNKTWKLLDYKGGFRHIYFVHQLQNLFYALTGEELTIKEEEK